MPGLKVTAGLKVAALLLGTCSLLLFAAEIAVKLYFFGWNDSPKAVLTPSANPVVVYELRPGVTSTSTYLNPAQTDWPYRMAINSQGFRGEPAEESPLVPRVVILGDSYAFGFGVNDDETFASQLSESLSGRAEVLNWGVPGYNTVQQSAVLLSRLDAFEPDVVVVAFHPNDFEPPIFSTPGDLRLVKASHLYGILRHLRWGQVEREQMLVDTGGERMSQAKQAFEAMLDATERRGVRVLLFKSSCWGGDDDRFVNQFFRSYRDRIPILNTDPTFCAELEHASIPNDGHPTAEGHELLAQRLLPHLERLLAD